MPVLRRSHERGRLLQLHQMRHTDPLQRLGNAADLPHGLPGQHRGYGIYLDGQPYGHLANKESIRIPLPMGTHTLHMTCGMTRRCEDLTFTLTPEAPAAYVKASIRMGFWSNTIRLTPADPSEMPQA